MKNFRAFIPFIILKQIGNPAYQASRGVYASEWAISK